MQRRLAPVALILPCVLAGLLALAPYSPRTSRIDLGPKKTARPTSSAFRGLTASSGRLRPET
jgi:hypothetical protein